ncbi:hypothetical protein BT69DRAFT_138052 [Atractiella rhizophila]|nr:hypothetical protein BT69DRAFT_138052 [Atractiella rhizophila]
MEPLPSTSKTTIESSTLRLSAPSLHRNQACKNCRARKIRCDAKKPTCTPCSKGRRPRQGKAVVEHCTYPVGAFDASPEDYKSSEEVDNEALKKRIDHLESQLKSVSLNGRNVAGQAKAPDFQFPDTDPNNTFFTVLYPGYPSSLPHPSIVWSLIERFYEKFPMVSPMLPRAKFLYHLSLPPSHVDYPIESLLHSILAIASFNMDPNDAIFRQCGPRVRYWGTFDGPSMYHYSTARSIVMTELGTWTYTADRPLSDRNALFQLAQSSNLLTLYAYLSSLFLAGYTSADLSLRLCLALGLNQLVRPNPKAPDLHGNGFGQKFRYSSTDNLSAEELEEKTICFWVALINEFFSAVLTGWRSSTRLDSIATLLPIPVLADQSDRQKVLAAMDPSSPNFILTNPPELVGLFQLQCKIWVLIARVLEYLMSVGCGWHRDHQRPPPQFSRDTEYFQLLERQITDFRNSFPQSSFEGDVTSLATYYVIHTLTHVATILLHSSFMTDAVDDISYTKCVSSATALSAILVVLGRPGYEDLQELFCNCPFVALAAFFAGRMYLSTEFAPPLM